MSHTIILLTAAVCGRDQEYTIPLTDFALVQSIGSMLDGEPLIEGLGDGKLGLSKIDIIKMLKQHDVEFTIRARPAWRGDGDKLKHARGFYEIRIFLWEQFGPLAGLDYKIQFLGDRGAKMVVRSHLELDIRRFGPRYDDRIILMIVNRPLVHRLVTRIAEAAVQAAEYGIIWGYVIYEESQRDKAREERRNKP